MNRTRRSFVSSRLRVLVSSCPRPLALLLLAAVLARPAGAEGLRVDSDTKLNESYNHAKATAAGRNWSGAIAEYHRILSLQRSWVCVMRSRMGVYQGVANAVLEDLLAAPTDAWSQYESQFGAEARTMLEAAQHSDDVRAMEDVAYHYPLTAAGREALSAAVERSVARGRVGEAVLAWQRFCTWYGARPGAGVEAANTSASLAAKLFDAVGGSIVHLRRMESTLAALEKAGGEKNPFAGPRARAAGALASADAKSGPPWDWPTLEGGGGPAALMTPLAGVGEALWSYRFPVTQEYFLPQPPTEFENESSPNVFFHVTADAERIYVSDGQAISAFDRQTGLGGTPPHKAWRHYYRLPMVSDASNRSPAPVELGDSNCYVASLDERSVYAVLGAYSAVEPSGQTTLAGKPQLVCLEKSSGTRRWLIDVDSSRAQDLSGIVFFSTPLPVGERLYILGIADKNLSLFCLDRNDGRRIWSTALPVGLYAGSFNQTMIGQLGTPVPVEAGGWIYVCNHAGSLSAVDALTGAIRWSASYLSGRDADLPIGRARQMTETTTNPVVLADGLAVCHAPGAERIVALDQATGEARWSAVEIRGMRHLYGASEGRVYASGNDAVAIDTHTGKMLWRSQSLEPGIGGRGGLTPDGLVVAAGKHVLVLDLKTGSPRITFVWGGKNRRVGNLLLSGDVLAVASSDMLTVFRLNPAPADGESAERLVAGLGDDDPAARDNASRALAAQGEAARAALLRGLDDLSPEVVWRCRLLLERIEVTQQLKRE